MPTRAPTISSLRTGGVRPLDTRPTAADRGYDSRWARYSRRYLRAHPLCVACTADGLIAQATAVDHIVPIRQGGAMWDPRNHQALCHDCHTRKTGRERRQTRRLTEGLSMVTGRLKSVLCLALLLALTGCLAPPASVPVSAVRPSLPQQVAFPAIPRATLVPPSNSTDLQALPVARISRSEHALGGQSVSTPATVVGPNSVAVAADAPSVPDPRVRSPARYRLLLLYGVLIVIVGLQLRPAKNT
jgi:5-methylcytosine-specific restriction enzyme A